MPSSWQARELAQQEEEYFDDSETEDAYADSGETDSRDVGDEMDSHDVGDDLYKPPSDQDEDAQLWRVTC